MQKLLYFSFIFIFTSCVSQKQQINIEEIIYNATTRGRTEKITIKKNSLHYKTHLESKTLTLSKQQLKEIDKEVSKINLGGISSLKAPTNKRLFDGAMHTSLVIKKGNKQYTSITFDDTSPPAELKKLCLLLISLVQND